jgi:hypothetical protein
MARMSGKVIVFGLTYESFKIVLRCIHALVSRANHSLILIRTNLFCYVIQSKIYVVL